MKTHLQNSILLVFLFILLASTSYGIWGGTVPPKPSKTAGGVQETQDESDNSSGDDSLFIVREELFPECVQNNDEIEVSIYLEYPKQLSYDRIDVEAKIYDGNSLIYSTTKNGLGKDFIHFTNITASETTLKFVFTVHADINDQTVASSVEYFVLFSSNCLRGPLLENDLPFPNPTYVNSRLKYDLGYDAYVSIWLIDSQGQATLIQENEEQNSGEYEINLNMNNLSAGTYYYRISAYDGKRRAQKTGTIIKNNFNPGGSGFIIGN